MKLEKFAPCLQMPFSGWTSVLNPRVLAVLPFLKPWKSLHAELAGYFKDPRLQLAFTFQSKYLGMSPFQCPSLFSILSFLEYEHGIWHPTGGCNSLTRGMARVPTARSDAFVCSDMTAVTNSGNDVPTAITVNPRMMLGIPSVLAHLDGFDRLGHAGNLVQLDQDRVGGFLPIASARWAVTGTRTSSPQTSTRWPAKGYVS